MREVERCNGPARDWRCKGEGRGGESGHGCEAVGRVWRGVGEHAVGVGGIVKLEGGGGWKGGAD